MLKDVSSKTYIEKAHTLNKLKLSFVFTLLLLVIGAVGVQACGGFFCTTQPIDQNAERIIFLVNPDNTLTAIVGINYVGAAEDFSWVIPVPSPPELGVAETRSIDALQMATEVNFQAPPYGCGNLFAPAGRGGGGDGGFQEFGQVGPYDYAILGSEDPAELITWLRDFGYQVTESMEPIIGEYVADKMYFLALRLSQDSAVGDIQPIRMTYTGQNPMIPLKLTAIAAVENMPVYVWIFANQAYKPTNWANPTFDFSGFRGPHSVSNMGRFVGFGWGDPRGVNSGSYNSLLTQMQADYDGKAFVTELSQPTSALFSDLAQDDLLAELVDRYTYLTRHYAQLSPSQMTLDPVFMPDPDATPISRFIDLKDWVDPMTYWGCSSRTALTERTLANLPTDHTRLDDLALDLVHPDGWQLSSWTVPDGENPAMPVYALSPAPVTVETVAAHLAGQSDQPLLLVLQLSNYQEDEGWEYYSIPLPFVAQVLGLESGWTLDNTRFSLRHWPYGSEGLLDSVITILLTTEEDYAANQDSYNAMLAYALNFQYYRHPELKHTIFLANEIQIGYPEGWVEHSAFQQREDGRPGERLASVTLHPEGVTDGPRIHRVFGTAALDGYNAAPVDSTTELYFFYNDGRQGFVVYDSGGVVEFSAPDEVYNEWEGLLEMLVAVYLDPHPGDYHGWARVWRDGNRGQ